jgi:hypothetical protein
MDSTFLLRFVGTFAFLASTSAFFASALAFFASAFALFVSAFAVRLHRYRQMRLSSHRLG